MFRRVFSSTGRRIRVVGHETLRRGRHMQRFTQDRLSGRGALSGVTLAISGLVVFAAVFVTSAANSERIHVSAHLKHTGDVSVRFADQLHETTSPACGCISGDVPGGWNGFTFPGYVLDLSIPGKRELNSFELFTPDPAVWSDVSTIGIDAWVTTLDVTGSEFPDAYQFLEFIRSLPPDGSGLTAITGDQIEMKTRDHMLTVSNDPGTVAALGVPHSSVASVEFENDRYQRSEDAATAVLRTRSELPRAEASGPRNQPMLDLASNAQAFVIRWETDSDVLVQAHNFEHDVQESHDNLIALAATQAFSRRPVLPPKVAHNSKVNRYLLLLRSPNGFATRLTAERLRGGNPVRVPIDVRIPKIAAQAKEMRENASEINEHPMVRVRDIPFFDPDYTKRQGEGFEALADANWETLYDRESEDYEYPILPAYSGINIFGALSYLRFEQADGDLLLDDKAVPLKTGAPIELNNLRYSGRINREMRVPVQIGKMKADINVAATADVTLNGYHMNSPTPAIYRAFSFEGFALVIALASFLMTVFGSADAWRRGRANRTAR